ncbi:NERD domain-containing protein [Sediminispirochaeta smaragdinae]|uniref:NERD domain-containing protein n=1 Tax=Sediminispirochaeta smaragdinae (strain DSM 11293 / JCM 15392 / SEBR 4228) TaxID=573413 RepID=E1RB14_SEDSS|nr:NERD domain-containing protein [Sediminispirochaeta smaragdinae]ADK79544.1 hypothetical protein Spirs_0389 [Sediminispirochaeta smaragdinae DSM 11293]
MIEAILNKKIRQNKRYWEDVIFSSVFGMLKYLNKGILYDVLKNAKTLNEKENKFYYLKDQLNFIDSDNINYEFWKHLQLKDCKRCEPDLIIEGPNSIVCIEAKYKSGKSSKKDNSNVPNDQLAKEYDNLSYYKGKKQLYLIYLTSSLRYPIEDIKESIDEYNNKRKLPITIYWLNWNKIYCQLDKCRHNKRIIDDICLVLEYFYLDYFTHFKISSDKEYKRIDWRFR